MPDDFRVDCASATFGPFVFAPADGELRRHGDVVPLQRQPAMVLEYLLDHADRIVTREELIQHVWRDHHVKFDQSLNYCIRQIRRALNEDPSSPTYFQTVPRRGYRWIARVASQPEVSGDRPSMGTPALWRAAGTIGRHAATTAAGFVLAVALSTGPGSPVDRKDSPRETATRPSQLGEALHALHVLSHAVFEPGRNLDAAGAGRTLWRIVALQLGLSAR